MPHRSRHGNGIGFVIAGGAPRWGRSHFNYLTIMILHLGQYKIRTADLLRAYPEISDECE